MPLRARRVFRTLAGIKAARPNHRHTGERRKRLTRAGWFTGHATLRTQCHAPEATYAKRPNSTSEGYVMACGAAEFAAGWAGRTSRATAAQQAMPVALFNPARTIWLFNATTLTQPNERPSELVAG